MIELLSGVKAGEQHHAGEIIELPKKQEERLVELGVAKYAKKDKKSKETPRKIEGADKAPDSKEKAKEGSKDKETK